MVGRATMAVGLLALAGAGCNECPYIIPHCEDNAIVSCGEEDQQLGAKMMRSPCFAPNSVCVDGYRPFCATTATPSCTPRPADAGAGPHPARCEGQVELKCFNGSTDGGEAGFEVYRDCSRLRPNPTGPAGFMCVPMVGCTAR